MVQGLANPAKGHTYLDIDHLSNTLEALNHEITHHNGQGETSANIMGKIADFAYNIGTSLNQQDINTHRQAITPTTQTLQNLSTKEQLTIKQTNQTLLDANEMQRIEEMGSGDEIWNNRPVPRFINVNNPNARRWNVNNNPHAIRVRQEIEIIRQTYPSFNGFSTIRPSNSPITQQEALEYTNFRIFLQRSNQTYSDVNLAYREFQNSNRYNSTLPSGQLNIGRNNANFNVARHNTINTRDIQQIRINQIRNDFNSSNTHPKDMKIAINGNTYYANPITSQGAPVYRRVTDRDVQDYYMQISGIRQMPAPQTMGNRMDIYGRPAQVWTTKPIQGPLAGATINLRTFSSSQNHTQAKYTIEITGLQNTQSGINSRKIEIKFEK